MQRVYALLFLILAACCLVGQCQQSCQANHAGPHCDPLCSQRGSVTAPSDPGGYGQFLAFSQQPACTRAMTLQIDSHCGTLTLQIDSIGTSPTLTLYSNLSATFVTPTDPPNAQTSFFVAKYNVEPGQYVVIPVADSKSCLITAQAISDLSVVIGAVSGGTQSVYSDTPSKELTSGVASYPVMHAFNLPKPGAITRITFFQNGNQNYGAPTAVRYRCAYDVYAGYLYTCNSASSYRYMAEGFDENGYKFMRSDRMPCIAAPPPTTSTPPTTTTESACLSGGTLVALRECLCPPFYTGSRCETMMCYNGGTLMGNNTCFCQIGYSGTFCQDVKCMEPASIGFNTNFRTLTIVLFNDATLYNVFGQIRSAILNLKDYFTATDPDYFSNFVLTTYNSNGVSTASFGTFDDLIGGIMAMISGPTLINPDCQQPIMAALQSAITQSVYPNFSPIYVFTYGVAKDYQLELSVTETLSFIRAMVNFIQTPQLALGCVSDPMNPMVGVMNRIASFSQGIVAPFNNYQLQTPIQTFLNYSVVKTYKTDTVFTGDYNSISNMPVYLPFFVDSQTASLVVFAVGSNLSLIIVRSSGTLSRMTPIFVAGSVYIWEMTDIQSTGPYQLDITGSAGPCSFRVYARSNLDLFFAVSNDLTQDYDSPLPIWQTPSHMIAHVNNHNYDNPDALYAELHVFTQDRNDKQQALYLSSGAFRSQCRFELYFGSLTCPIPNQMLYITIHAYDNNGKAFQRMTTGYCAPGRPTQLPPSDCLNGGVQLPSNSSLCICPPYFNGNRCETSVCLNGGTTFGSKCQCPPGTSGLHCEIPSCYQFNSGAAFSVDGRSLVIAIEIRILMLQALNNFKNQVSTLIREVNDQSPRWIQRFVLITFTDISADLIISTPDPSAFMQAVQGIQPYLDFVRCEVMISQALQLGLNNSLPNGMVFVFTRSSIFLQSSDDATIPYTLIDQTQAQVNFIITSPRPCQDAFQTNVTTLMTMWAQYSGGVAMVATNNDVAQWISYIPTQYRSGLVTETFYTDCSSQNQSVYFPIEARTTAFVFTVTGNYPTITLYQPDGTVSTNYYSILNSNQYGQIEAVLQKCDTFFNANENNCYMGVAGARNWLDARDYCHSRGAYLADILDLKKQQYLSNLVSGTDYWSGLNDIMREGTFVWDDVNGVYRPQSGYSNWGSGEPLADPTHIRNCVSVRHSQPGDLGAWYTDDCNKAYAFVCQKHPYNNTFEPDPMSNVLVPAGLWTATVQTQTGSCFIQVRSQSSLQVYNGYTLDVHSDIPMAAPILNRNAPNRVLAHVTSPAKVEYTHFIRPNLTLTETRQFSQRDQCAYEWISDTFICQSNSFSIMTLGVDDLGYPFQRMRAAICQNPALGCLNNGYFDGTKCQCPKYWTGALCQTAVCVNGGSNDGNSGGDGTACNCPSSYSGQFCEQIVCSQQSPPNFGYGSRSLVLIVDASINFIPVFNTFKAGLSEFLNAVGSGTRDGFFRNYIFIPMYGAPAGQPAGSLGDIFISTSIPDFVAAVNNTLPLIGGCPLPIYSAILTALSLADLAENSVIYVISNSLAQDVTTEAAILVAVQQTRAQISFVLPGDGVNYGCGSLSNSNPNVLSYQNLTLFSGGALFFPVAQNLMALLNTYTSTLYGGAIITEGYQASCGQMQLIVPVEYGLSNIDILVRASTATLSIASPNGTLVTPLSYLPQSTGTYFGHIMLSIADVTARGYWIMNITTGQSPIPCVVQVKGSSNVQLYYQFVQGVGALNMDGGSTAPSPLTNENYIIVHAAGVHPSMAGRLTFVEFFDLQLRQTVFVLPLVKRKSCSYEYISATSFTCPGKSFGMSVNGLDDSLLPFKRLYFVQCSDTSIQSTVTTQAPLTALNMINADFIFAIDVAEIADTGDFQVTKVFIEKFVENCTVGPQNSQFAVLTYNSGGVTNDGFNLNSYSSSLPLLNAISNMRLSITQDPMTDLMGTINYILNTALQPSAGYRNGQAFVIFMATSTASISDTNQTLVLSLNQATTPYAFNMYGSDLTKQYIQPILNDYPNSYSSLSKPSDFLTNPAIAQQFTQYIQTRYQGSLTTPSGPLCRQPYVQQETCGMIDIVLVLDASTSMPSQSFTDLQCFFSRYFASKVIGTTGVQVAAIVYAGSAFVRWDITQSSDLSSLQTAIEGLAQLQTSEDPANSGQNIFGALTIVQSSVTTRPAASKFIVLVSSKPYSGADPRKIADELRTSFTILGVSFDPNGNNIGLLQLLSGDAKQVLQIPNSDQFGQFLKQFVCS